MDSNNELHPNWRALATIHLPLKRFIREGALNQEKGAKDERGEKYEIQNVDGDEVAQFYETLTTEDKANKSLNPSPRKLKPAASIALISSEVKHSKLKSFDEKQFFRYAMENNANGLKELCYKADDVNTRDSFGWTGLMMAACANSIEAVKVLLELGARTDIREKSGRTAEELARMKSNFDIVELLNSTHESQSKSSDKVLETDESLVTKPFFCETCKRQFEETSYQAHLTSTVHQFNTRSALPANKLQKFNIPPRNAGLKLMVKQGWDKESGLGPNSNGRLYPVKTVIRKQRTGLGIEQAPARVTHYEAFDLRATKSSYSDYYKKKPRNRNDIKREKHREWKRERRLRNELS